MLAKLAVFASTAINESTFINHSTLILKGLSLQLDITLFFVFLGMKTARNIFIATLAVADSTLCLLTMPMTLLGIFLDQVLPLCKYLSNPGTPE